MLENMEDILGHWETFARKNQPAHANMSSAALRDHAEAMLKVIAADLASDLLPKLVPSLRRVSTLHF